jgi:predicted RNase H-like HicB family nuclease
MTTFQVKAHWDREARVWWAESDDLPGLVAEAATHEQLVADLLAIIPDLVALNLPDLRAERLSFALIADRTEELHPAA